MLLRITYSNTKRFLKTTINSFKSYFTGGYQRLPKAPPCNPFSCSGGSRGGAAAATHAAHFHHSYREPPTTTNSHHCTDIATTIKKTSNKNLKDANLINNHYEDDDDHHHIKKQDEQEESSKCLVTRKLKELEMMDRNNSDLVLDIEEVLHYYSRLTCPVYRDIIEKFFVQMYTGTFVLSPVENQY